MSPLLTAVLFVFACLVGGTCGFAMMPFGNGTYRIEERAGSDVFRVREGSRAFGFLFGGLDCGSYGSIGEARRAIAAWEQHDREQRLPWRVVK